MSKIADARLICVAVLLLAACSSPPVKVQQEIPACAFPATDKAAPAWVCSPTEPGMVMGAIGSASRSDAGIAFMKQMASVDARGQIALSMREQVQKVIRQYAEANDVENKEAVDQVIASVAKQITAQTVLGTKIFKHIVAPDGTLFALVGLDEVAVQKLTETSVKISISSAPTVWQNFLPQKNPDELAAEIAGQKLVVPAP